MTNTEINEMIETIELGIDQLNLREDLQSRKAREEAFKALDKLKKVIGGVVSEPSAVKGMLHMECPWCENGFSFDSPV